MWLLNFTYLGANETISILDLSWNQFRLKGAVAIANGLKASNNILFSCFYTHKNMYEDRIILPYLGYYSTTD